MCTCSEFSMRGNLGLILITVIWRVIEKHEKNKRSYLIVGLECIPNRGGKKLEKKLSKYFWEEDIRGRIKGICGFRTGRSPQVRQESAQVAIGNRLGQKYIAERYNLEQNYLLIATIFDKKNQQPALLFQRPLLFRSSYSSKVLERKAIAFAFQRFSNFAKSCDAFGLGIPSLIILKPCDVGLNLKASEVRKNSSMRTQQIFPIYYKQNKQKMFPASDFQSLYQLCTKSFDCIIFLDEPNAEWARNEDIGLVFQSVG